MIDVTRGPLVVGVADRAAGLSACAELSGDRRPFDLVEARLDLFEGQHLDGAVLEACVRLEATGAPVLVTVRAAWQGGRFVEPESVRLSRFREALQVASWADVEQDAPIAAEVAAMVRERPGGQLVVSHHDFQGTPPLEELSRIVDRCRTTAPRAIAKIAATIRNDGDRSTLRALLARHPERTAVIGMGDDAFRIELATAGSLLAYGYVGDPTAPGQTSAETLHARLLKAAPAYAARRVGRPAGLT